MKLVFLLISLFSSSVWSKVSFEIILESSKVKQGEIIAGKLLVSQTQGSSTLSGLEGLNLDETIYLMNVSPFVGKNGDLESQIKLIFLKKPEVSQIIKVVNGEEAIFQWSSVDVSPTEEPKSFLLGDFEIPERSKYLAWLLGLSSLLLLLVLVLILGRYIKRKKQRTAQRNKIKSEILNCKSYEEIVFMWKEKQKYLGAFPEIGQEFKNFEDVLFKYQFKASQTTLETEEVIKAYNEFSTNVSRVLNGI